MPSPRVGAAAIFFAKLVFMVAGYALVIGLTRTLTQAEFGDYSVVFGAVALVNMVVINGTMQTVSRFVASDPANADAVRARALAYQAVFVVVVVGVVIGGAGLFAARLRDPALAPYLRWAMLITAAYSFYAINVGFLNGQKRFLSQAALDISYSILKVGFIVSGAALGYGLWGVVAGFAGAAFTVLAVSFVVAGLRFRGGSASQEVSARSFVRFALSVMGVALLVNSIMQADLFLLKALSPLDVADGRAGLYGAAQQLARIPYYVMATASLVLFPVVASLGASTEAARTRRADTVSQAFTGILGIVGGMAAVTAPIGERVVRVVFPTSYVDAAAPFAWLVVGLAVLALVNVSVTMISGSGRPGVSVLILVAALVVQVACAAALIPSLALEGAALSTVAASVTALALSVGALRVMLGLRIAPRVVVVVALACLVVIGLGRAFDAVAPEGRVLTAAFCALSYALYLLLLALGGVLLGAKAHAVRVLLVTKPLAPPYNDGSKVLARALATHLDGDRVALLSTRAGRRQLAAELAEPQPEVVAAYPSASSFANRGLANLSVLAFLVIARFHYRALHFFFAPSPLAARVIRALRAISPGVKFVQTVMSRPKRYQSGVVFGDVVTAGSDDTARQLREVSGRPIEVVRPGVVVDVEPVPRASALGRLGWRHDAFHVLFAGDVDEGGALAHLPAIAHGLLDGDQRLCFHFSVRRKTSRTEELARSFVDTHLARYGERARAYFDHLPFHELLDAADLMVLPQEHLLAKIDAPLVVLEMMARGKPVVLLDRAPLDEIPPPSLRAQLLASSIEELIAKTLVIAGDRTRAPADVLVAHARSTFDIRRAAREYRRIHASL